MATYFAIQGGGNWSSATTWALSTGQTVGGAGVPTNADTVYIDVTLTGIVSIDTTSCVCKILDTTGAVSPGSIDFGTGQKLTVSGNVTFDATTVLTGTGNLTVNAASTITPNGVTIPGSFTTNYNGTMSLAGNLTVTGLYSNTNNTLTLNGFTMYLNGGFSQNSAMRGTTVLYLQGGTWTSGGQDTSGMSITINGNVTISGQVKGSDGCTIKYLSGTVTQSGAYLRPSGNMTLDTNGMVWDSIRLLYGFTLTLASDLQAIDLLLAQGSQSGPSITGAFNITCVNFLLESGSTNINCAIPAGITLTVTTSFKFMVGANATQELKSNTPSSQVNIVYQGTLANCVIGRAKMTDLNFTGSSVPIYNWYGNTLTNVTGVTNVTGTDIGGAINDFFGIID